MTLPPLQRSLRNVCWDLQIKLDRAQKERDRLKNVQDKKQEELLQAQMRLDAKMNEVQEVLAAIEAVKKQMDVTLSAPAPACPDDTFDILKLVRWMRKEVLRMAI